MKSTMLFRAGIVLLSVALSGSLAQGASERYGGIEIGAKGVKWVVIDVDRQNQINPVTTVASGDSNTTIAQLEAGAFTSDALADTGKAISAFFEKMTSKANFNVKRGHVFIVASSGVPKAKNQADLDQVVKTATEKTLSYLSVEDEVRLNIKGLALQGEPGNALFLDIGSGNTKGGFLSPTGKPGDKPQVVLVKLPGTVTFTAEVEKLAKSKNLTFAAAAEEARKSFLVSSISKQLDPAGEMKRRNPVYLAGGIIWAMATIVHPEQYAQADVAITPLDIAEFKERLTLGKGAFPEIDETGLKPEAIKEIKRVRDVFTPDNLTAGAEIIQAMDDVLGFKGRDVFFARNGRIAWLVGYVAENAGLTRTTPPQPKNDYLIPPENLSMPPRELLEYCGFFPHCYVYSSNGCFELATKCYIKGLYHDCVVLLSHGVKLEPSAVHLWYLKGVAEIHLGLCSAAEVSAKTIASLTVRSESQMLMRIKERVGNPAATRFRDLVEHLKHTI